MNIICNGESLHFSQPISLQELVQHLKLPQEGTALAVNNALVPQGQWTAYALQEKDSVVIIRAAQGG